MTAKEVLKKLREDACILSIEEYRILCDVTEDENYICLSLRTIDKWIKDFE